MLAAWITFAAEEGSKTPYYVAGSAFAAFAVIVSLIGISRHETFPGSKGAARIVMLLAAVLAVATAASAVLTG